MDRNNQIPHDSLPSSGHGGSEPISLPLIRRREQPQIDTVSRTAYKALSKRELNKLPIDRSLPGDGASPGDRSTPDDCSARVRNRSAHVGNRSAGLRSNGVSVWPGSDVRKGATYGRLHAPRRLAIAGYVVQTWGRPQIRHVFCS